MICNKQIFIKKSGALHHFFYYINIKNKIRYMSNNVLEIYNTDDILIRNVIAGVLSILNNNINYDQVWGKDIVEKVTLPWFFDMGNSSSERFLQDNFTYFGDKCFKKIEGNFDMLPRGVLSYVSTSIDTGNITNRFVEGKYTRFENGKLTTYKSFLYSIPLTLRLNAEIWVDTFGNVLKIEQAIRESLYRNKTFYVMFRGMKIGCCMGLPDDYSSEKTTDFSFQTSTGEQKLKINFEIVVETYQPVFDRTTEVPSDCVMKGIGFDIIHTQDKVNKVVKMDCDDVMVAGASTRIVWNHSSNVSDVATINIEYAKTKDEEGKDISEIKYYPIILGLNNQNDYYWEVPTELSSSIIKYNVSFCETDDVKIIKEPVIKILPIDNKIKKDSFIIVEPGYFLFFDNLIEKDENGEYQIPIEFSYKNKTKLIKVKDFGYLNLKWGRINEDNPITILKDVEMENIYSRYNIRVSDGVNSEIKDEKEVIIL